MSQSLVNQITIDCLLNKELLARHVMKQRERQTIKDQIEQYKPRIEALFTELINNTIPENLSPDVKYTYDSFLRATIEAFKIEDQLLHPEIKEQEVENDIEDNSTISDEELDDNVDEYENLDEDENIDEDDNLEDDDKEERDAFIKRSIDMSMYTLDKYVVRKKYPQI